MYRPQHVLNGNADIWGVTGRLDDDRLWISLMVLQYYRGHGWVGGGGIYFFFWKIVIVVIRMIDVELD